MACMVPDCTNEARNRLGIRLRKSKLAVYAPDLDAFLCKRHAEAGGHFTIEFEPAEHGAVEVQVTCGGKEVAHLVTPIHRRAS